MCKGLEEMIKNAQDKGRREYESELQEKNKVIKELSKKLLHHIKNFRSIRFKFFNNEIYNYKNKKGYMYVQ